MNEAGLMAALATAQGANDRFAEAPAIRALARAMVPNKHGGPGDRRSPSARFFSMLVFGAGDCWYWRGAMHKLGYGLCAKGTYGESKAHRVAWRLFNGPIPDGFNVCHRCDVRSCVNPAHLFLGTQGDNVRDMFAKGRANHHHPVGESNPMAKLTAEKARAIREEYARGGRSMKAIAAAYGVWPMTVCRIVNRKGWKEVV